MANARICEDLPKAVLPPQGQERALRLMLEEARQIALQAGLLALNAAFESAGACAEPAAAAEMHALGTSAARTAEEMQRATAAVEQLLEQIRMAGALSQPL